MGIGIWKGALAGMAGTTALNATTYLDMSLRGRPTSDAPQQLVETVADRADVDIPGSGDERDNRLAGLGPLSGTAVGVGVGVLAGVLHELVRRGGRALPAPLSAVLIGAAAMASSDVPLKLFGISDPATWRAKDWASDAVPHVVYGLVTHATLQATDAR